MNEPSLPRPAYWNDLPGLPEFPQLTKQLHADVAIVGGGIVGIITARLLKDKGQKVVVLEGRKVGQQVTGKSTAKVTSQHGTLYQTLDKKFGEDTAREYGEAQEAGLAMIRNLVSEHDLQCDLESADAYVYALDDADLKLITKEHQITRRIGLPSTLVDTTELPFSITGALRFSQQAQFHPARFVAGLAQTIPGQGCHVFENSRVLDWEPSRVITGSGEVRARHVVMATHLPLGQIGACYTRSHAHAKPVIAAPIAQKLAGMHISAGTPTHSIRCHQATDGTIHAIATGPGFIPGRVDEERKAFADVEQWLMRNFDVAAPDHKWVNEDFESVDSLPLVGWSSKKDGYLIATGFNAWGFSNGAAAAVVLAGLATGRQHSWAKLFDARRLEPVSGGAKFIKENSKIAARAIGGHVMRKLDSTDQLAPGEAAIVATRGNRLAAFKDEQGRVHAVSAVCTHMGCLVGWNETDRTWDCPCHGSRFQLDGCVIHGPATRSLGSSK